MAYVSLYEATRIVVRTLPGGEGLIQAMTDEWFRRGVVAFEPDKAAVAIYQDAVVRLEKAIQSGAADVVDETGRAIFARNHNIDVRNERLVPKAGYHGRVMTGVLVDDRALAKPPKFSSGVRKKERLDEVVARALRKIFPGERPTLTRDEMIARVSKETNRRAVSTKTMDRALLLRWPTEPK